jgi:hypothetical protein
MHDELRHVMRTEVIQSSGRGCVCVCVCVCVRHLEVPAAAQNVVYVSALFKRTGRPGFDSGQ